MHHSLYQNMAVAEQQKGEHPDGVAWCQERKCGIFAHPTDRRIICPCGAVASMNEGRNGRIFCRGDTYARSSQAPYHYAVTYSSHSKYTQLRPWAADQGEGH